MGHQTASPLPRRGACVSDHRVSRVRRGRGGRLYRGPRLRQSRPQLGRHKPPQPRGPRSKRRPLGDLSSLVDGLRTKLPLALLGPRGGTRRQPRLVRVRARARARVRARVRVRARARVRVRVGVGVGVGVRVRVRDAVGPPASAVSPAEPQQAFRVEREGGVRLEANQRGGQGILPDVYVQPLRVVRVGGEGSTWLGLGFGLGLGLG